MTELETLQRAKMYLDKLANGIDPLTDAPVGEGDVVNQVRISRCLFYVSDVLRQVIDQGGIHPAPKQKAPKVSKTPFTITPEQRAAFVPSREPIAISVLTRQINQLIDNPTQKELSYLPLRDWLLNQRLLYANWDRRKNSYQVVPSPRGLELGIREEMRQSSRGPVFVIQYGEAAQQLMVDHLDEILSFYDTITRRQSEKWSHQEEDQLLSLMDQGKSLIEISRTLQRDTNSIRTRLKKIKTQQSE